MNKKSIPFEFSKKSKIILLSALAICGLAVLFDQGFFSIIFNIRAVYIYSMVNPSLFAFLVPYILFIVLFFVIKEKGKTLIDNLFSAASVLIATLITYSIAIEISAIIWSNILDGHTMFIENSNIGLYMPALFIAAASCAYLLYLKKKKGSAGLNILIQIQYRSWRSQQLSCLSLDT